MGTARRPRLACPCWLVWTAGRAAHDPQGYDIEEIARSNALPRGSREEVRLKKEG